MSESGIIALVGILSGAIVSVLTSLIPKILEGRYKLQERKEGIHISNYNSKRSTYDAISANLYKATLCLFYEQGNPHEFLAALDSAILIAEEPLLTKLVELRKKTDEGETINTVMKTYDECFALINKELATLREKIF